jgi:ABC-type lipoprotein export system ATPase subunit
MALLTLKDIGKIYVSEGNVAVGIRGVNLSFERGEFVAITGKSGSGKSTLLNVISGMDSYEEGELLIEGQPTSHFLQPEWEEYREKYISFIFQDYNIIESFTVLQNVELALMHIEDKRERRHRALELIRRVGLSSHVRQKGSRLSGGQKQRTVIARALAKDSPIILADEPTGNLDSATSKEIIELLREVSKDKLLIVVTHNFEQVEACATRHIRVFDGAVESDHVLSRPATVQSGKAEEGDRAEKKKRTDLKNGLTLGRSIFTAKPRLSIFLCLLMIIGALGVFLVTTLCGEMSMLFEKNYMFEHIDGRVVLTKQNGAVITDAELEQLAAEYGAEDYLHYDILLDESYYIAAGYQENGKTGYVHFIYTYGEDFGNEIIGAYPSAPNEVFLYLPISCQPDFGTEELKIDTLLLNSFELKVSGVAYYYDNNLTPKCLFTKEGFGVMTSVVYMRDRGNLNITMELSNEKGTINQWSFHDFLPSYNVEENKIYIDRADYRKYLKDFSDEDLKTTVNVSSDYYNYNWYQYESAQSLMFNQSFDDEYLMKTEPIKPDIFDNYYHEFNLMIHPSLITEMAEGVLSKTYRQASLFFADDKAAHEAAERLCDAGYIAVPSDTTYVPDAMTTMSTMLGGLVLVAVWLLAILFLAFFINLCSSRALGAFKGDMAIMRSMGIPVKVIRVGMYVRMLISLIPAYILVAVTAILIFTTPKFNAFFVYLYPWQYALIFVGMLILTVRITHKQIRRLFGESVKKSLRGGAAE